MDPLELRIRRSYYVRLIITGILTVGIGFLIMGLEYIRWARAFDTAGLTRRDGKRLLWQNLKEKRYVHMRLNGAVGPLNHIELIFDQGKALVFPFVLENAGEAMAYVEKIPARKIT